MRLGVFQPFRGSSFVGGVRWFYCFMRVHLPGQAQPYLPGRTSSPKCSTAEAAAVFTMSGSLP